MRLFNITTHVEKMRTKLSHSHIIVCKTLKNVDLSVTERFFYIFPLNLWLDNDKFSESELVFESDTAMYGLNYNVLKNILF